MKISTEIQKLLKNIPSVDVILDKYENKLALAPYSLYIKSIRSILNEVRNEIKCGKKVQNIKEYTFNKINHTIELLSSCNLKHVINGTGIILHTGLGRSPLSNQLIDKALMNIKQYSNLELDLLTGKRGERNSHVEPLIMALTDTEASLVVNNNAAAVLLMLNSIAEGKEVIISRGEQVEIGGSFRIPDVIRKSGCIMVEVGTTNKTHLKDYEEAINSNTGAILVAHTSNYKVVGFTKSVELSNLSKLAKKKKIPLLLDLGCGVIANLNKLNLPHEDSVDKYIKSGADVVAFSGDKMLGGPQAGILCGKKKIIKIIHKNALYRALRSDKFTFAILESILRSYLNKSDITSDNLSITLLQRSQKDIQRMCNQVVEKLSSDIVEKFGINVILTNVEVGSGSLPLEKLPSAAIEFSAIIRPSELSYKFRTTSTPILGYIKGNKFYIDFKAIPLFQKEDVIDIINSTLI